MSVSLPVHGRGAAENPTNRFEKIDVVVDPDGDCAPAEDGVKTIYLRDSTRKVIAHNDSPDVGFEWSINPYRGCEHGCIYCYARPTHEWLGFSAGLDFETKIMVKMDAPELLAAELSSKKWKAATISVSGVTDCYQPVERKLQITRKCIRVMSAFGNPFGIITKSALVTRDIDILAEAAKRKLCVVMLSVTTLDEEVHRVMEPRASTPRRRLEAIAKLTHAGVPVGVMVAPVVPGLTDHEVPAILKAVREAGAMSAGYVPVRLPYGVKDLFEAWLERHFPDRKSKVLNRIMELRGGKLNDSEFGSRMHGEGIWAEQMKRVFEVAKRRVGMGEMPGVTLEHFRVPDSVRGQMELW
jgi:DNA repair photolyase